MMTIALSKSSLAGIMYFPFNKPLLSTSSVLGTVLTPEGSEADEKSLCPQAAHSLAREEHTVNTSGRVACGSCFP